MKPVLKLSVPEVYYLNQKSILYVQCISPEYSQLQPVKHKTKNPPVSRMIRQTRNRIEILHIPVTTGLIRQSEMFKIQSQIRIRIQNFRHCCDGSEGRCRETKAL